MMNIQPPLLREESNQFQLIKCDQVIPSEVLMCPPTIALLGQTLLTLQLIYYFHTFLLA